MLLLAFMTASWVWLYPAAAPADDQRATRQEKIRALCAAWPFMVLWVPLIKSMDMNLIWFGIVVIKLLEIGLITPPIGLNVVVIKSVVGKEVSLEAIFKGVTFFLLAELVILVLLLQFPGFALFVPNTMF